MQDGAGGDIHLLLGILADGEEQARQLDARLGEPDDDMLLPQPRAEAECCRRGLARQLRCTFGKAMAVARAIESAAGAGGSGSRGTDDRSDSPRSADESSGGTARDAQAQEPRGMCKRRKGLPRWTQKFRLLDTNLEYSPDDGFSWRKYGQKDILGAKFPRGYYRCTYRNAQGCPATKQVQRSDSDLTVFDVTYQGVHTCHQKQRHAASPPAPVAAAHDGNHPPPPPPPPPPQDPDLQLLASFKNSLKVETDGPAAAPSFHDHVDHDHGASTAAFSFPSVPPFHNAAAAGGFSPVESGQQLGGGFSPAFVSPAAASAGSSYFSSVAHCPADTRGAEPSELGEVVSAATASAVDPAGFDYSLYQYEYQYHHAELDPHLPFAPLFDHHSHGQFRDA